MVFMPVGVYVCWFFLPMFVRIVVSCLLCALAWPVYSASASRPNVLLIVADDLGIGDVSSFSPALSSSPATVPTTNLDALAAHGMRFTRFYTESTCSASRAALLTGQYSARLGFHPVARGISPDVMTLPKLLQSAGYATVLVGKWHLGEVNPHAAPRYAGFDQYLGYLSQWMLQGPDAQGNPVLRHPVYQDPWLEDGVGHWQQYPGYLPDILTQTAVSKIEALSASSAPWFMLYASPLPHAPLHAPPGTDATQTATDEGKYRAMVQRLDQDVGSLLSALDRSGQRQNTLVILLSDNGAPSKREGSNGVYAGGKGSYSEGGIRTPMIWVDPTRVEPGSIDARAVAAIDILPSLAARLSLPLNKAVDGLDVFASATLLPLRERALFWLSTAGGSVMLPDQRTRYAVDWWQGQQQAVHWYRYTAAAIQDWPWWRWAFPFQWKTAQNRLAAWMDDVLQTPVQITPVDHGQVATSADFLRTPLKNWDFYVAARIDRTASAGQQVLAEQAGSWSLVYQPEVRELSLAMHGGSWSWPVDLSSEHCAIIGVNADLYDRYTNADGSQNASRIRVSVNGKTLATAEWHIDSLRTVDEQQPTWIGRNASGQSVFTGQLAGPWFFHRANAVGQNPFGLDEKKRQALWCKALSVSMATPSSP